MNFNPTHLVTSAEATEIVSLLNEYRVGGGVSKVYLPEWLAGPAGFSPPAEGAKEWWHADFNNGAKGFTLGLILSQLKRYPYSQQYVLSRIHEETLYQVANG